MKLEEGMYVRTKRGINKINEYVPQSGQLYLKTDVCVKSNVLKASHNIIDLIEVGDYVNGWRVNKVEKKEDGTLLTIGTITSFVSRNETEPYLTQDYEEADKMCKIKSIVTKEQFEAMVYKVV